MPLISSFKSFVASATRTAVEPLRNTATQTKLRASLYETKAALQGLGWAGNELRRAELTKQVAELEQQLAALEKPAGTSLTRKVIDSFE